VTDLPAQTMRLDEGANVEELVNGLHAIGTTSRDVIAILQAIKAERWIAGRIGGSINGNANFCRFHRSVGAIESDAVTEDHMLQQIQSGAGKQDDGRIEKGAKEFESMLLSSWLQQAEQSMATVPGAEDEEDSTGRDQMMSLGVQSLSDRNGCVGWHWNCKHDYESPACKGGKGRFRPRTPANPEKP